MAGNLKKFINPRFIKTIDLALMKALLARHETDFTGFSIDLLDQEEPMAREALHDLLTGSEDACPEGLRADLHRIAELGDARGLEIIQAQADRQGINLFPDLKAADKGGPNKAHDPKHIAVRVFLEHPDLFDAAADHMAMMAADRLHEFAGNERGATVDLTAERIEVEPPSPAECATWVLTAPPMRGGEYLTASLLLDIWSALDRWATEAINSTGGLEAFLQSRAPKWHQVGRVCFHLAENQADDARPFAFLATYAKI